MSFYSTRPKTSKIATLVATLNCSSDEEDGYLSDDDDVRDPDFEPLLDQMIENDDIDIEELMQEEETTEPRAETISHTAPSAEAEHSDETISHTAPTAAPPTKAVRSERTSWQRRDQQPPTLVPPFKKDPENFCAGLETPYEYF